MLTEKTHLDPDTANREFYNAHYDVFIPFPFEAFLPSLFSTYVPSESRILEIGSGPGTLAEWLVEQKHTVVCIEPGDVHVRLAKEKRLNVIQSTFQAYEPKRGEKYECIAALSSLIHIKTSELPAQIKRISNLLIEGGIAIFSFIEGDGEGFEDPTEKGMTRFFAKISEKQLDKLLLPHFEYLEKAKVLVPVMKQYFWLLALRKI